MYGASGVRYGSDASSQPATTEPAPTVMGLLGRAAGSLAFRAGNLAGRAHEALDTEIAKSQNRRFREARLRTGNELLGEYSEGARDLYRANRLINSIQTWSIRLIWVYGGQNGSPHASYVRRAGMGLDCTIKTVSLKENPYYVAVSYTWGAEPADHFVRINKFEIPVTRSCYQALSEMPRIAQGCYVWIDQLCVDQANPTEKGMQIQLMGAIFSRATSVFVWLGDSSDAKPASHILQASRLAQAAQPPGIQLLHRLHLLSAAFPPLGSTYDDLIPDTTPILSDPKAWEELGEILSRPYFHRRWIIQEVAASQNVSVVFRGHLIDWVVLWDSVEKLFHLVGKSTTVFGKSVDFELFFGIHRQSFRAMDAIRGIGTLKRIKPDQEVILMSLLDHFRGSEATNARDCFYAFRSICSNANELPEPHYASSVREIFEKHAVFFIERGQGARILQSAGLCNNAESSDTWPTWCPKWGFEGDRRIDRKAFTHLNTGDTEPFADPHWERLLAAGGSLPPRITYIGNGQLRVHGRVVGKIAFMLKHGIQDDSGRGNSTWLLFNQQEHIDFARKHASTNYLPPDAPRAFEIYRQTGRFERLDLLPKEYAEREKEMFAIEHGGTKIPWEEWHAFEQKYLTRGSFLDLFLCSLLKPDLNPGVKPLEFPVSYPLEWNRRYNENYQRGRFLAVTETGRLGMVSVPAAVGDLIVILQGFAVPLILSPPKRPPDNKHIIVSDAYFLGWMSGEAYASPKQRLTSFVLI